MMRSDRWFLFLSLLYTALSLSLSPFFHFKCDNSLLQNIRTVPPFFASPLPFVRFVSFRQVCVEFPKSPPGDLSRVFRVERRRGERGRRQTAEAHVVENNITSSVDMSEDQALEKREEQEIKPCV